MTAAGARMPSPQRADGIALALGGGSARGLAHIVVLETLDELGLEPVAIAGTSMGSICGALYAAGLSAREMREDFERQLASRTRFVRRFAGKLPGGLASLWSPRSPSVIDNVTLFEMILPDILHCDFAALRLPFVAVAADFYAIEQVLLDHGPLIPALAASCALPAWARPVVIDGRVLIDGGYVNPVPFDVVMDPARITIAVDVTGDPQRRRGARVPHPFEAMTGAAQLLFHSITREKLKSTRPDILIRPDVGRFGAFDFFKIDEILAAAASCKEELKRQLAQRLDGPN